MICVCNDLSSITMPLVRHARTCLTCSSCLQLKQPVSVWQYWKSQTAMKWTPGMARGLPVVSVVFFIRTRSMAATNTQWQLKWWMWLDQVAWTSLVTLALGTLSTKPTLILISSSWLPLVFKIHWHLKYTKRVDPLYRPLSWGNLPKLFLDQF